MPTKGIRINAIVEVTDAGEIPKASIFSFVWDLRVYLRGTYFAARLKKNSRRLLPGMKANIVIDVMDAAFRESGWTNGAIFQIRDDHDSVMARGTVIRYGRI